MSFEELEAIPLIDREDPIPQPHAQSFLRSPPALGRTSSIVLFGAVLVSLTSFLANGYALSSSFQTRRILQPKINVNELRRPSLYLGLDRVPEIKNALQIEDIVAQLVQPPGHEQSHTAGEETIAISEGDWTVPTRSARVNSRYPNTVFPHDDWVVLTELDRALVEFPISPPNDTTMCLFTAHFPERRALRRLLTIESDGPDGDYPSIRITSVPETGLDIWKTSWNTRAKPGAVLGTVKASFGVNDTTLPFKCPIGETMLAEFECVGQGCRIEYENKNDRPMLGIGLTYV